MMLKRVLLTVSLVGLLALTASPLQSQVAETALISREAVVLQVWANAVPLTLRVVNGEMARLSTSAGLTYGLTPRLTAEGVILHLFEISSVGTGGERMRAVDRLQVGPGARAHFGPHPLLLEAQFAGREAIPAREAGSPLEQCTPERVGAPEQAAGPSGPDSACTRCCVTCDGIRACACAVSMSCGSCCCSDDPCGGCE